MSVQTLKDGTDVAMMGVWDLGLEPVTPRLSMDALEAEVAVARLAGLKTSGDGSFEIVVCLDEELPEKHQSYMEPIGGPFLLHAKTGRICLGSTEFYRTAKIGKIRPDQKMTVTAGDYSIRWFQPVSLPEREFAQHLGEERYAQWQLMRRQSSRSDLTLALAVVLSLILGYAVGWQLGVGIFAGTATVLMIRSWWRDRRDPGRAELRDLEYEFAQRTGHDGFEEVEEQFFDERPDFAIELRRLETGAEDLIGGWANESDFPNSSAQLLPNSSD